MLVVVFPAPPFCVAIETIIQSVNVLKAVMGFLEHFETRLSIAEIEFYCQVAILQGIGKHTTPIQNMVKIELWCETEALEKMFWFSKGKC
jgi:hypothetical protein